MKEKKTVEYPFNVS